VKPEIVIAAPDRLARVFADRFAAAACTAAIATRGQFACALPGGSVAEMFLPVLARGRRAWDTIEFFWGDERAVGPNGPDSNFGIAKRLLLDAVVADPRRIHRIAGEGADLEAVARAYEDELTRVLGAAPSIDLLVLGFGSDGHVCSLFPGHPLLAERECLVAAITDSPKPPARRSRLRCVP
jgi:6-phosphogluconolactonase